jgi:hypothetical protein
MPVSRWIVLWARILRLLYLVEGPLENPDMPGNAE